MMALSFVSNKCPINGRELLWTRRAFGLLISGGGESHTLTPTSDFYVPVGVFCHS
jgi:hypothetical protein